MDENLAKKILIETEQGYDLMVEKFSQTRKFFWRDLEFIKEYAKNGDKILDYGCGNGRLMELFNNINIEYYGVDVSQKLVDLAKNKHSKGNFQKIKAGQISLSFPDDYFNAVYAVAIFHHLPSRKLRLEIANELYRITRPNGHVIITVWNLWQRKYVKKIIINWLNKLFGQSKLEWNDGYISFKNNSGEIFQRYHHAFVKNELKNLFEFAGFRTEFVKINRGKNIVYLGKK